MRINRSRKHCRIIVSINFCILTDVIFRPATKIQRLCSCNNTWLTSVSLQLHYSSVAWYFWGNLKFKHAFVLWIISSNMQLLYINNLILPGYHISVSVIFRLTLCGFWLNARVFGWKYSCQLSWLTVCLVPIFTVRN